MENAMNATDFDAAAFVQAHSNSYMVFITGGWNYTTNEAYYQNSGYNEAVKGYHLFCNNDMSIISIIIPSFDDGSVVTSLTSSRILTYPAKSREEAVTHTLTLYTEAGTPFNGQ